MNLEYQLQCDPYSRVWSYQSQSKTKIEKCHLFSLSKLKPILLSPPKKIVCNKFDFNQNDDSKLPDLTSWPASCLVSLKNGKEYICVTGGSRKDASVVSLFDFREFKWTNIESKSALFEKRWNHSATFYPPSQKVFIFGGFDSECNYNSVTAFSFETNTFESVKAYGEIPKHRAGHSACLVGDNIFVFGGFQCHGGPYEYYNDCFSFNCKTYEWKKLNLSGQIPSPRSQHASVLFKNKYLFIIGGQNESTTLNDIHILDLEINNFVKLNIKSPFDTKKLKQVDFRVSPCRIGAVLFDEFSQILVQGEFGVYIFDIQNLAWIKPPNHNSFPRKTCNVCVKSDMNVFICGGFDFPEDQTKDPKLYEISFVQ